MTQEEKAKAYDEALVRARKMLNMILDNELLGFPDQIREIFPELRETEDERMLREIKRYIKEQGDKPNGLPNGTVAVSDMIDWLEKQKETIHISENGMLAWLKKQEEEEGYEAIPVESTLEYKLGFKAGKESEKQKDLTTENIYKHSRERMSFWNGQQKEQKLNPDKEKLIRHCIGLILTDATDERFKDYGLTLKDCLVWLGEQKEQKQEWSEEDENMAYFVNQFLEYHENADPTAKSCKKWFNNRFKSIKPHWKPSEEQIHAIIEALKYLPNNKDEWMVLNTLVDVFKKLI